MKIEIIDKEIEFDLNPIEAQDLSSIIKQYQDLVDIKLAQLMSGKVKRTVKIVKQTDEETGSIKEYYNGKLILSAPQEPIRQKSEPRLVEAQEENHADPFTEEEEVAEGPIFELDDPLGLFL